MFKQNNRRFYVLLAVTGLTLLILWPTFVTAMPLTAAHQLQRSWGLANTVGRYDYRTDVIQTNHPTAMVHNIGRTDKTKRMVIEGEMNRHTEAMFMKLWGQTGSHGVIELKVADGQSFGRVNPKDEWQPVENQTNVFAPGGDPLGYLVAAENVKQVDGSPYKVEGRRQTVDKGVDSRRQTVDKNTSTSYGLPSTDLSTSYSLPSTPLYLLPSTVYQFDLNGLRYAEFMRGQMEAEMQRKGELPSGVNLGLIRHYVDMTGTGEIWLNEQGLPIYQAIHLAFPPEKGELSWAEADLKTTFTNWGNGSDELGVMSYVMMNVETGHALSLRAWSLLYTPESGFLLGLAMLMVGMVALSIIYRNSQKVYAALSLSVIASMLVTPLMHANQVQAFNDRQQAKIAEQEADRAKQADLDKLTQSAGNNTQAKFNPQVNPLAVDSRQQTVDNGVGGRQQTVDKNASTSYGLPSTSYLLPAAATDNPATTSCDESTDYDCDGLTDTVENNKLGTWYNDVDSDHDGISDYVEVKGYTATDGQTWYLNPLNPDSNGDGRLDGFECIDFGDVGTDGTLSTIASTTTCTDTDNDKTPDIYDYDDDGDGVPDSVDDDPTKYMGGLTSGLTDKELNYELSLTSTKPVVLEFNIRPTDSDHLWYNSKVLDWPSDDTEGQVTRKYDTTLYDEGDYDDVSATNADNGDMMLLPMLEIEIPYNSSNPSGGLPIAAGYTTAMIDYSSTDWVDTDALDDYGISVNASTDGDSMLMYVTLNNVEDSVGDTPVAFSGSMYYEPNSTTWGSKHQARLLWMVQMLVDTCDTTNMPSTFTSQAAESVKSTDDDAYDLWCAYETYDNNGTPIQVWTTSETVVQTYYDNFYVTAMAVREENGVDVAMFVQKTTTNYENYLWFLGKSLQDTWLEGQLNDDSSRFDVLDVDTTLTNWSIPSTALASLEKEFDTQLEVMDISTTYNETLLNSAFPSPATNQRVNLLYLSEDTYRATTLSDSDTTTSDNSIKLTFASASLETEGYMRFSPFVYQGAGVWDSDDLDTYMADLETDLSSALTTSILNSIVSNATISSESLTRDGAVSLAANYYLSLYNGASGGLALNNSSVSTTKVSANKPSYSSDPLISIVQTMATAIKTYYGKLTLLGGDDTSSAWSSLSSSLVYILESFGEADAGTTTTGSYALNALTNYANVTLYWNANIFDTSVTAAAISSVVKMSEAKGQAYSITASAVKVLMAAKSVYSAYRLYKVVTTVSSVSRVVKPLRLFSTTTRTFVKAMRTYRALAKTLKFWAVVGLIIDIAVAIGLFLYTVIAGNISPSSLAFTQAIAMLYAQIIVAVILFALALNPIGMVVVAIIALIDAIIMLVCAIVGVKPGSEVDKWVCGGISGAVTQALLYVIFDQSPLVDLSPDSRLDMAMDDVTVTAQSSNEDGFVQGNLVQVTMAISSYLYMGSPTSLGYTYWWQFSDDNLNDTTFDYALQNSEKDFNLSQNKVDWDTPSNRTSNRRYVKKFDRSISFTLSDIGLNKTSDIYLTEGYNMPTQECWLIYIPPYLPIPICYLRSDKANLHTDLSDEFAFDVFPKTVDDFNSLTLVSDNSYRLSWDSQFPTLADADNDGLMSKAKGGVDPNDSNPDSDGDGLSDYWEYENGYNMEKSDEDGDGLYDYWEEFHGTDPALADSDGDGLTDAEEVYHPATLSANVNTTTSWSGGWRIVYQYDSSNKPQYTWVQSDPNDTDTDDDNTLDNLEETYGYNPHVPSAVNVLTLDTGVGASIIGSGQSLAYTATVNNQLDYYARGLVEAEFPTDTIQQTTALGYLTPLGSSTMKGSVTGPSTSGSTEMTIRAGAVIEDLASLVGNRVLWLHANEASGKTTFVDDSLRGNNATCSGTACPTANGSYLQFDGSTDKLTVNYDSDFNLTAYSVGVWVKPTAQKTAYQHFIVRGNSGNRNFSMGINPSSWQVFSTMQKSDCSTWVSASSSTGVVKQDVWNHVMTTYDGSTTLKLYVNGVYVASSSANTSACSTKSDGLSIGGSTSADYVGYLDEVEIYNKALDATTVKAIYTKPVLKVDMANKTDDSGWGNSVYCGTDGCGTTSSTAMYFNQASYMIVNGSALDVSNGDFSFATWIYPESRSNLFDQTAATYAWTDRKSYDWQGVLGYEYPLNQYYQTPSLFVNSSGGLRAEFGTGSDICRGETSTGKISYNTWQQVAVTYSSSNKTFQFYVNGINVGSSASTCSGGVPYAMQVIYVGRPNTFGYLYWDKIYNCCADDGDNDAAEFFVQYDGTQLHDNLTLVNQATGNVRLGQEIKDTAAHYFKVMEDDGSSSGDDTFHTQSNIYYNTYLSSGSYSTFDGSSKVYWSVSNDAFKGYVKDLRWYRTQLDADSLSDLYLSTSRNLELTFDEAPGEDIFTDSSGNGLAATCDSTNSSCPQSGIPGRSNQTADFDGSNDILTLPTADELGLYQASFSVMAWVKLDSISGDRSILGTTTLSYNKGLHLLVRSGKPHFGFYSNDTTGSTSLSTGTWYHLAWVYDSSAKTQTMYVNGVKDATVGSSKAAFDGSTDLVYVGKSLSGNYFDGRIDHLVIANSALSQSQVQTVMEEAPVLNLHLDESSGATSFKDDGFSNNATCSGTACPTAGGDGWMREAVTFDGSNDMLTVADSSYLDLDTFSVALWVKPTAAKSSGYQPLVTKQASGGGSRSFGLYIGPSSTSLPINFSIQASDCATYKASSSSYTLTEDQWNHLVMTFDGAELKLYKNGNVDSTTVAYSGTPCQNSHSVKLGYDPSGYPAFEGMMDEVAIYGQALTADEVDSLYSYQEAWYDTAETHEILVDAENPTISLDLYTNFISAQQGRVIGITANDVTSGIAKVEYQIDGGAWQTASQNSTDATQTDEAWTFSYNPTPGQHTINVKATDNVGKTATAAKTFTVDGIQPSATLANNTVETGHALSLLQGTVSDSQSGVPSNGLQVMLANWQGRPAGPKVKATVSGSNWSATYPISGTIYGQYTVKANVTDNVGNNVDLSLGNLKLDSVGPNADVMLNSTMLTRTSTVLKGVVSDTPYPWETQQLMLHFEESSGVTSFIDGSSSHYATTCTNCPTSGTTGKMGNGALFDGTNDTVQIASDSLLDLGTAATLSAWIKPTWTSGTKGYNPTIMARRSTTGTVFSWHVRDNYSKMDLYNGSDVASVDVNLSPNTWAHVAMVYDDGTWTGYVNGKKVGSVTQSLGTGTNLPLNIGSSTGTAEFFTGMVDEVAIFDRAFNGNEVYNLANSIGTNVTSLELRFRHADSNDINQTAGTWLATTLTNQNTPFTPWQLSVPSGLEGPHKIDLRATDSLGNQRYLPNVWTGEIDTKAPQIVAFSYSDLGNNTAQASCQATDYNLTSSGWVCPSTGTLSQGYQSGSWFTSLTTTQKLYTLTNSAATVSSTTSPSMTACDNFGNCVTRVINTSAATTTIKPQLWLKANAGLYNNTACTTAATATGTVACWADQSGNGYHLTQATSTNQPTYQTNRLNSQPAVQFDTTDYLTRSMYGANLFASNEATIFFIKKATSTSGVWFKWESSSSNRVGFEGSSGKVRWDFPNDSGGQLVGSKAVNGSYYLIAAVRNSTTQAIYLNGKLDNSKSNSLSLTTNQTNTLALGKNFNGALSWQGDIVEVLVYKTALSDTLRQEIEYYLAGKYGLTLDVVGRSKQVEGRQQTVDQWVDSSQQTVDKNTNPSTSYRLPPTLSSTSYFLPSTETTFQVEPTNLPADTSLQAINRRMGGRTVDEVNLADLPVVETGHALSLRQPREQAAETARPMLNVSLMANGQVVTPNSTINWQANPSIVAQWSALNTMPTGYQVQWLQYLTSGLVTVVQSKTLAANQTSDSYQAGEGQKLAVQVTALLPFGQIGETVVFYVDYPTTPVYADLTSDNWLGQSCSLIGVDDRMARASSAAWNLNQPQQFYTNWDSAGLWFNWTGANWQTDGDLFIYLDTKTGGATQAYNPYTTTATVFLPSEVTADTLIWVREDSDQAGSQLLTWNGTTWQSIETGPAVSLLTPNSLSLYIPFSTLGISNPTAQTLNMVAFATEENALKLWATMPSYNNLSSERVIGAANSDEVEIFTLLKAYQWSSLGAGLCPNGNLAVASARQARTGNLSVPYNGANLAANLGAEPAGVSYNLFRDNLIFLHEQLFPKAADWSGAKSQLCANLPTPPPGAPPPPKCQRAESDDRSNRNALNNRTDLARIFSVDHPHVINGQKINYSITVVNNGTKTAKGLKVMASTAGPLRLLQGTIPTPLPTATPPPTPTMPPTPTRPAMVTGTPPITGTLPPGTPPPPTPTLPPTPGPGTPPPGGTPPPPTPGPGTPPPPMPRITRQQTTTQTFEHYEYLVDVGELAAGESRTITFEGQVDTTFDVNRNDGWTRLMVQVYDETGDRSHPAEELHLDHEIDDAGPSYVEIQSSMGLVGNGLQTVSGFVRDQSNVPTIILDINGSQTTCTDDEPEGSQWTCQVNINAADGASLTTKVQAIDQHGFASEWFNGPTLYVDSNVPLLTFSDNVTNALSDGLIGPHETLISGESRDGQGLSKVEVCNNTSPDSGGATGGCQLASLLVDTSNLSSTTHIYEDDPGTSIVVGSNADCQAGQAVIRTFSITDNFTIADLNVGLNMAHDFRNDVVARLISPSGKSVELLSNGSTFANLDVMLDDTSLVSIMLDDDLGDHDIAEPYYDNLRQPYRGSLYAFRGEAAQGVWTLKLCDHSPAEDDGLYYRSQLVMQAAPMMTGLEDVVGTWQYELPLPQNVEAIDQSFVVYGYDSVGNKSEPLPLEFKVDTQSPNIVVIGSHPLTASHRMTHRDTISYTFALSGMVSETYSPTLRLTMHTANGELAAQLIEVDEAGNWVYTDTSQFPRSGLYCLWVDGVDVVDNQTVVGPFAVQAEIITSTTVITELGLKVYLPIISQGSVFTDTPGDLRQTLPKSRQVYLPLIARNGNGESVSALQELLPPAFTREVRAWFVDAAVCQ